jgi:SAM-dependent methyltransferase
MSRHNFSISLPDWLSNVLRKAKRTILPPPPQETVIDLSGSRDIEWSYIASRLPMGPGYAFDFGCGLGNMCIHAVQKGYKVMALDLEPGPFPWTHAGVEIVRGDLLKLDLPDGVFDFILNCSTVEHVGLSGRYGVAVDETDGDLAAMQRLRKLLKPTGKMLITIPCGRDAVIVPWHRVYGEKRLPKLLSGYIVEDQDYWVKHADNVWYPAEQATALSYVPTSHPTHAFLSCYALACFVLGVRQ